MLPEVGGAPDPKNKLQSGSLERGQYRPEAKVSLHDIYSTDQQRLARVL